MPIYQEVFDGDTAEAPTMPPTVRKVLARYPHIRRLLMVADRELLSIDNLNDLASIALPSGQPLEFILAVPGRRYGEFAELLQPVHDAACAAGTETTTESKWQGHRLNVAHDPAREQERRLFAPRALPRL
jgi:hypothetical protein